MAKEATTMFSPRPQLNADAFVTHGSVEPEHVEIPPTAPAAAPSPRLKQGNGSHSYKHKSANYLKLRRIAQRLDVNIGDLLDEALEAKMPEFEERARRVEW
jgi:hypothetical protein